MKLGTVELLKFKKLKRRLKLAHWQAVGLLEALWLFVQRDAPLGDIGRHSDEDIASALEWADDPESLVESLVETGWLDRCQIYRLVVHDWADHAPQWLIGNLNRWGKSFAVAGVSPPLTVQTTKQPAVESTKQPARQAATAASQIASSLLLPSHTIPSPPTKEEPSAPNRPTTVSEPSEPTSANWGGVGGELKEFGIKRPQAAIDAAKGCGFNPPQVLALIAWLRHQPPGAYEPGVLVERLACTDAADWEAHENWPPPKGTTVASEPDRYAPAKKTAQQLADDEREARRKREAFLETERLNSPFVEVLDGLDDDGLAELVAGHKLAASQLMAKGRDSPEVRPLLLKLLREREREAVLA